MKTKAEFWALDEYRQPIPVSAENWSLNNRVHLMSTVLGKYVSTVFLGLDHNYDDGPPLLFETMIFCGDDETDRYMTRCSTFPQALWMHIKGCCWAIYHSVKEFLLS